MCTLPLFPHFDETESKAIVTYHGPDGDVEARLDVDNKTVWQNQRQIADGLHISQQSISQSVKHFKEERGAASQANIQVRLVTSIDGKKRRVEHYDLTLIAYIGFRANANEYVIGFQNWVGEKLKEATAQPIDPAQLKRNQDMTAYQLKGKSHDWAELRVPSKEGQRRLNATASETHVNHKPNYGSLAAEQNQGLFDRTKREIVEYLGLLPSQADSYRDHLGKYALIAVNSSNSVIVDRMKSLARNLTTDEQLEIVRHVTRMIAPTFRDLAEYAHVDYLSGSELDEQGNALVMRNVRLIGAGR